MGMEDGARSSINQIDEFLARGRAASFDSATADVAYSPARIVGR
jgi:hypothetical protein